MNWKIIVVLVCCLLTSCKKEFKSEAEFYKFWNDKTNGLKKEKIVNDFKITVKYMPVDYLTYNEIKSERSKFNKMMLDSVKSKYQNSRTFLLTIEPINEKKDMDLLFQGATSFEEYKMRINMLNFNPGEYVKINAKDKSHLPVLSTMENAYNIDVKKNLYLVFANENNLLNEPELDFEFNDMIFETGINHFVFQKKDIDNIPSFKFL
jgi:hypothetical protein